MSTEPMTVDALLEQVEKKMGFVPNMFKAMSASPAALQAYQAASKAMASSTLRPRDQQIAMLTAVSMTGCHYCQAAHGKALKGLGVSPEDIESVKAGGEPNVPELAKLVRATRLIMKKNGFLEETDKTALAAEGIGDQQLVELAMLVAMKSFTSNVAHLSGVPIDSQFSA